MGNRTHSPEFKRQVVLDRRAMVDKCIGDALMAVFGAPVRYDDHSSQACLAALEMEQVLAEYYEAPDRPPFHSQIGIHTEQIVVGNIVRSDASIIQPSGMR